MAERKDTHAESGSAAERTTAGGATGGRVERTVSDTVGASGNVSRGIVTTVRDVLHETIDATEQVGTDVGRVARNAALGIVGGVGTVGGATVGTARDLLVGVVGGVRDVLGAAIPRSGRYTGEAERQQPPRP